MDSGPGSFEKNVLVAEGSGSPVISASFGGFKSTRPVLVLGKEDFREIAVEPSPIVVQPGESVSIKVSAVSKANKVYTLSAANYTATVDRTLGMFKDGSFQASGGPAAGELKVRFADLVASVPVTVRSGNQAVYSFSPGQPGVLALGGLSVRFTGDSFARPATITATSGGEFAPVPARYSSISTVRLQALDTEAAALAQPATVVWRYQPEDEGRVAVLLFTGGAWQELPSKVNDEENKITCRTWELGPLALVRDRQPPAGFNDVSGHWAAEAVTRLSAEGIISGYPGNTFAPSRQITRAEFVVLLCRALGWQPLQGECGFKDSGSIPAWARGYVLAAANKGAVAGYEDNRFLPSNLVTRSEMAAMAGKALSLPQAENIRLEKVFADGQAVASWAAGPVASVYVAGIMRGDNENKFRARDRATRAESAVLIDNILNYLFY